MSHRGGDVAANRFQFESRDPGLDKARFFTRLREFGDSSQWSAAVANEIELIFEEWWTNLLNYAFPQKSGAVLMISIKSDGLNATLEMRDNGIPFDPTAQPDPDLSLPVEERPIGGLGIYMIKKLSTRLSYARTEGYNILRIDKDLARPALGSKK